MLELTGGISASLSGIAGMAEASGSGSAKRLQLGEDYVTSTGERITVTSGGVKRSFVYLKHSDAPAVHGEPNSRCIFGNLRTNYDERPSETRRRDFRIVVDDMASRLSRQIGPAFHHEISQINKDIDPVFIPGSEEMRMSQRTAGGLAGYISTEGRANSIGIGYIDTGNSLDVIWELNQNSVQKFNSGLDYRVSNIEIDGPIRLNDRTTARITVENSGNRGLFRAVLGVEGTEHPRAIERMLEAQSTEELTVNINFPRAMKPARRNNLESGQQLQFILESPLAESKTTAVSFKGDE